MKNLLAAAIALLLIAASAAWAEPPTTSKARPAGQVAARASEPAAQGVAAEASAPHEAPPSAGPAKACVLLEDECPRVACDAECWEVRVEYGSGQYAVTGGLWGSFPGARCWAERVSRRGFWLQDELQPTLVPPAALSLIVIDRAGAGQ